MDKKKRIKYATYFPIPHIVWNSHNTRARLFFLQLNYTKQIGVERFNTKDVFIFSKWQRDCEIALEDPPDLPELQESSPGQCGTKHPNWFVHGQWMNAALSIGPSLCSVELTHIFRSPCGCRNFVAEPSSGGRLSPQPRRGFLLRLSPAFLLREWKGANLVNPVGWRKWAAVNSHPVCAGQRSRRPTTAPCLGYSFTPPSTPRTACPTMYLIPNWSGHCVPAAGTSKWSSPARLAWRVVSNVFKLGSSGLSLEWHFQMWPLVFGKSDIIWQRHTMQTCWDQLVQNHLSLVKWCNEIDPIYTSTWSTEAGSSI